MRPNANPSLLHTQRDLEKAIGKLVKQDPRLRGSRGFPACPRCVAEKAGTAGRLRSYVPSRFLPPVPWLSGNGSTLHFNPSSRRRCFALATIVSQAGLSRAKIKTLKAVARALVAEEADLAKLEQEEFEHAHGQLTALHGIGPWTADIYLLSACGHETPGPSGDLAIQEAVRHRTRARGAANAETPYRSRRHLAAPIAAPPRTFAGLLQSLETTIGNALRIAARNKRLSIWLNVAEVSLSSWRHTCGAGSKTSSQLRLAPQSRAGTFR